MRQPLAAVSLLLLASPLAADTLIVANKAEATVSLIDLATGEVAATLPTGTGPHEVGASPDGSLVLVSNYGTGEAPGSTLTLVDVPGARVVRTLELPEAARPHGIAWLDGRRAAVTCEGLGALLVVDVEAGTVEKRIETGQEVSHMVTVAPDGTRAYVANIGSGSVSVLDLTAGTLVRNVPTGEGAEGIDLAADGAQLWVTNREADRVSVLDTATLEPLASLPSAGFPIRARAVDDRVLVTNARSGEIAVFDTAALRELVRFQAEVGEGRTEGRLFGDRFGDSPVPIGVVVDAGGTRAWVAHANADVIAEIDPATRATRRLLRAGREPDGMAWSSQAVTAP
ncbi:MAG: YncE family protein [Thermoanaerobaculia bacterium]